MTFPINNNTYSISLPQFDIYIHMGWEPSVWDNSKSSVEPVILPGYYTVSSFPVSTDGVISLAQAKQEATYSAGFDSYLFLNWAKHKNILRYVRDGADWLCTFDKPIYVSGPGTLSPINASACNMTRHRVDPSTNEVLSLVSDGYFNFSSFESIVESNFDIYDQDLSSVYFESTNTNFKEKYIGKPVTYENNWGFEKTWGIRENITFPTLLTRGDPHSIGGLPGESLKTNVFVDKHPEGSMFYNGEIYRTKRISDLISKFTGNPGEVVTQVWEGKRQTARDGQTYVFLASGIQDPDYAGGYGEYTDETSREVTLRSDRSINVNFYYHTPDLPDYNFLMRVAVPDDVAHIIVTKEDRSSIKVKMHDGSVCTVDIVLLDDPQASPIRVMLPTGIYALKKIVNPA